jgi:hypothetical protein
MIYSAPTDGRAAGLSTATRPPRRRTPPLSVWAATLRGPQPHIYGGHANGESVSPWVSELLRQLSRLSHQRVSLWRKTLKRNTLLKRNPLDATSRSECEDQMAASHYVRPARAREQLASGTLHLLPFDLDTAPPPAGAWAPRPAWHIIDRDETLPAQDAVWAGRAARYKPYTLHPEP